MEKLLNYLFYLACSCSIILSQLSLGEEKSSPESPIKEQVVPQENPAPGFSYKNPLIVKEVKNDLELVEFQREFMNQWSEGYIVRSERLSLTPQNRLLQIFGVWNDEDERVVMYFDITEIAKKHRNFKDKDFQKKVRKALKKGPFKLPSISQAKKVSWSETSEGVREQIVAHIREDIKKGRLSDKLRQEIRKDIPMSDIPEDIQKEIIGDK